MARTSCRRAIAFTLLFTGVLGASVALAQGRDPFVGTWTLDTNTSVYEPANTRPARRQLVVEMMGDTVRHTTDTWRDTGTGDKALRRVTYTAKFDGSEYTIHESGATVSLTRVNANTLERIARAGPQALEMATWSVSPDGRTLTIQTEGVDGAGTAYNSTQYYTRQAANGEQG